MSERDLQQQRRLQRARRRQLRRAVGRVVRERLAVLLGGGLVIVMLTGTLGYSYVHAQVYDDVCGPVEEVDLSLTEMAAINLRAQDYQVDPSRDAHLTLASDEASFMMAQFVKFDVRLQVLHNELDVRASVPRDGGCVRVHAVGDVLVTDKIATFTPRSVQLGDLDVTGLGVPVGSVTWEPSDIEDEFPDLAQQLANIDGLWIEGDEVQVRLIDRYKLF